MFAGTEKEPKEDKEMIVASLWRASITAPQQRLMTSLYYPSIHVSPSPSLSHSLCLFQFLPLFPCCPLSFCFSRPRFTLKAALIKGKRRKKGVWVQFCSWHSTWQPGRDRDAVRTQVPTVTRAPGLRAQALGPELNKSGLNLTDRSIEAER